MTIDGVTVAKDSLVRVHPNRRADAQDIFFAGQVARVTAVLCDVDGGTHLAVVLVDDPAADMHEWYGRYFYFAPDELEPMPAGPRRQERRVAHERHSDGSLPALIAVVVVAMIVALIMSIPDIKRYLKIRAM